ncbi:hypothetical protein MMC30_004193 [Trapelia coarctata]|nr:hypothetical protein [Trapelia coarctata]
MANYFMCDGRRWQVPSIAPSYLATITPEKFASLFFALPVNKKQLGLREIRMLLTQCFMGMIDNRYGNGIQHINISRGHVIQSWKNDKSWGSKAIAGYATMPATPNAPDRSSRGLPASDVASDRRREFSQAQPRRLRGLDSTIVHGILSRRESRAENRRAASTNAGRTDEPRDLRDRLYRRLEDRVEDPRRQALPTTHTAEKLSGNGVQESPSVLFKRVKVEHQRSPPLSRPEPLTLKGLPPGHLLSSALNADSGSRPDETNGQPYSPTTPHLKVNWPISESSDPTEDSAGKESGLPESPALRRPGLDAQVSEHVRRGSLKRAREQSEDVDTAGGTTQPAPRAAEKPTERGSVGDGSELGELSEGPGAAGPAWARPTKPMRKPENVKPSTATVTTSGIGSLPSPSATPNTTITCALAGFFKPDDPPATNGTSATQAASGATFLLNEKTPGKLPVSNSQKQRQTQPRSANTHLILLETLLHGAVRELAAAEEPASAHQIRVVTLLHGAVAELENLKSSLEEV